MDYQIISANAQIGQIQVLYKQDGNPVATFIIDVPVVNGAFLTGEALDAEIKQRAPIWMTKRKEDLATATGFDAITALVQPLPEAASDPELEANNAMWVQADFEKRLGKALVKFGILQADPTEIPVTAP